MDTTEQPIFMGCGGGLSEADLHEHLSLDDVVQSVNGNRPIPMPTTTRYHENMAACALRAFFTENHLNFEVAVDTEAPGQNLLYPIVDTFIPQLPHWIIFHTDYA